MAHFTRAGQQQPRHFPVLFDLGPDITPRAGVGDKVITVSRTELRPRACGICPVSPLKSTAKIKPRFVAKTLCKRRARIEWAVGKPKPFKRVTQRCEKKAQKYGSFIALGLTFIPIKSVHRA